MCGAAPRLMKKTKERFYRRFQRRAAEILNRLLASLASIWDDIYRSGITRIAIVFLGVAVLGAIVVWLAERGKGESLFVDLFDGLWWSVVTIATVGYGDVYPLSGTGRLLAIMVILTGTVVTSILSGAVVSLFVERRIREGKGLRDVTAKNHVIVCGWNSNAYQLLAALEAARGSKITIALVNAAEADEFDAVRSRFPGLDLRFVRGDFTNEVVLKRAAAAAARTALFVPDETLGGSLASADERTVLGALALKSLNPDITIGVELLKGDKVPHLKRAGIDDITVAGEVSGFMLAHAAASKGLAMAARELVSPSSTVRLRETVLPASLVGKSFAEASEWFLRNGKGVLVGVLTREKNVSFADLLSDDSASIDAFILRKFQEADIDLSGLGCEDTLRLAPPADRRLVDGDALYIVG